MHFLGDVFAVPSGLDAWKEVHNVARAFAELVGVENDIVVVEIEDEGDIELLADGEKIVHAPRNIVILQHDPILDTLRQRRVIRLEPLDGRLFVAEYATEVEDHDGVPVLLRREGEEGEQFVVVFEVADGVVDHGFAGAAELCKLRKGERA